MRRTPLFVGAAGGAAFVALSLACGGDTTPATPTPEVVPTEATMTPPAAATEPASEASFKASDAAFGAFLEGVPALGKTALPPTGAVRSAAMKRPVKRADAERWVCPTPVFSCKLDEERTEFFKVGRVDISEQAVGILYLGVSDVDAPVVLVTYDPTGKLVGGQLVGGQFGDMEWGLDGTLEGLSMEVARYVWVNAEEKEYAEDFSYRIRKTGSVDRVIAP